MIVMAFLHSQEIVVRVQKTIKDSDRPSISYIKTSKRHKQLTFQEPIPGRSTASFPPNTTGVCLLRPAAESPATKKGRERVFRAKSPSTDFAHGLSNPVVFHVLF